MRWVTVFGRGLVYLLGTLLWRVEAVIQSDERSFFSGDGDSVSFVWSGDAFEDGIDGRGVIFSPNLFPEYQVGFR